MLRIYIFILLFFPNLIFAAAWVLPKNSALLIVNADWYYNDHFWDADGHLHSGPAYNQFTLNPYLEYGLTENMTIGQNSFFREVWKQNTDTGFKPGDSELFARYRWWHKDYNVFSTQLKFNVPWQHPSFFVSPLPPTVSNGQYWLEGRLLYGIGGALPKLAKSTWFLSLEGGFQPNFNGAADQINTEAYFGWKSNKEKWVIELKEKNTFTMHNPTKPNAPDFNLATIVPGIIYSINEAFSLEVGVYQDFWGSNIGKGTQPFIALWWHSQKEAHRIPARVAE